MLEYELNVNVNYSYCNITGRMVSMLTLVVLMLRSLLLRVRLVISGKIVQNLLRPIKYSIIVRTHILTNTTVLHLPQQNAIHVGFSIQLKSKADQIFSRIDNDVHIPLCHCLSNLKQIILNPLNKKQRIHYSQSKCLHSELVTNYNPEIWFTQFQKRG